MKHCIKLFLINILFFMGSEMLASHVALLEQKINNICNTQALEYIQSGNLIYFDALVGECACQVRAVKVASIYNKFRASGIDSLSPEEMEFLRLSYLLTVTKGKRISPKSSDIQNYRSKYTINEETSYKNLQKITDETLTYKPTTAVIQTAQRRLAHLSVKFLQELAQKYNDPEMIKALSYTLFDREETALKREHCGYYPSMKILLQYILNEEYVIGMYVKSTDDDATVYKLYYKPINGKLTQISQEQIGKKDPIIIIEGHSALVNDKENGISKLEASFSNLGLENIILANFAAHPQFAGNQKNADIPYAELGIKILAEEKNQHTIFAETHGCSLDNIHVFFLNHIYDMTGSYITP